MSATADALNGEVAGTALAEQPGTVIGAGADVTKSDDHQALATAALERFGRLDFWINNAGILPAALVQEITPEQISATLAVNVEGVLFGSQAAARHLTPGG